MMNNCIFARSRNANRLYVWQDGVFLFWMDAKKRWARSDLVQHLYDESRCKDPDVTPGEWFVDSSDFTILDEYEVPADALAALQEISSCQTAQTADTAAVSGPACSALSSLYDFGADPQTNAMLLQDAQAFVVSNMARIMAAKHAHDLCANNKNGTWGKWCEAVGISRDTGDNMVRVAERFGDIELDGQSILEVQPLKLLYAAAKPSAPADLVQAVKDGDITTHKQYQELLKENQQLRTDRVNAINEARRAESERDAALADVDGLHTANKKLRSECAEAEKQLDGARQMAKAANMRADKWQKEVEASKAQPVEAVVDEEEIDRRARQLAADMTAPLREELDVLKARQPDASAAETDARNAYDSLLLVGRSIKNAWEAVKPQMAKLPSETRAGAINMLNKTLSDIQTEAIKCL